VAVAERSQEAALPVVVRAAAVTARTAELRQQLEQRIRAAAAAAARWRPPTRLALLAVLALP